MEEKLLKFYEEKEIAEEREEEEGWRGVEWSNDEGRKEGRR